MLMLSGSWEAWVAEREVDVEAKTEIAEASRVGIGW